MHLLKVEFFKLRHRKMGLLVAGMGVFQLLYMIWATKGMDAHELAQGWKGCLYLSFQINIILMPLFIATIASRLSDIEHKGNTFKSLKTMIATPKLFHTKILCGGIYLGVMVLLQVGIMLVVSQYRQFIDAIPTNYIACYGVIVFLVDSTVFILQLVLSLLFTNQMIAFMVAIAGTFLGLYSMFFSEQVAQWILWGYYALLAPIRMNWDEATRIVDYYWIDVPIKHLVILIILFIGIYGVGRRAFIGKEQ